MKILSIRGKNLASLEGEFAVDFREEPLCSAGLFAITGPTGAGKTTILDAMCIALYNKAPRLDNVKSKKDNNDKNRYIVENSVKTILRRGANDGYAEVDFTAVDGNEYRTRWSISRKRRGSKSEYHDPSFDLTNLTTGEHCSYSAAEHGERIQALVGLSYQQFTRAVLLAQGNFAAFLKAEEGEKGAILQALTGTDIYSRISEIIFSKRKKAKEELEAIEEKRNCLNILSHEDLALLKERKETLSERQSILGKVSQRLLAKKNWLERYTSLLSERDIAEKELTVACKALNEALPQVMQLQKIDSLHGARDTYVSLCNTERACINGATEIKLLKEEIDGKRIELKLCVDAVAEVSAEQERVNKEWLEMKPKAAKALSLEQQLLSEEKELKRILTEKETFEKELAVRKREHDIALRSLLGLQKDIDGFNEWFDKNRHFENAVPFIPSIVINIRSARNDEKQMQYKELQCVNAELLLKNNVLQLEEARKREEKLNSTLSSEIAALRERLVEGEPCPVCGSRHHEIVEVFHDILAQEEIEREKENIRQRIAFLEGSIENVNREISVLRSGIELHKESFSKLVDKNKEFLRDVINADELLANQNAIEILEEISSNWNKFREGLLRTGEEIAVKKVHIENIGARIKEDERKISDNVFLLESKRKNVENIKSDIKALLDNFVSAKEAQEHYESLIKRTNKAFTDASEKRLEFANVCATLDGRLSAKEKSLADNEHRCKELVSAMEHFLRQRDDNMDMEEMKRLLSIDSVTIISLRKNIESLNNDVAKAKATKEERERNIAEHLKSADMPNENEDTATLQNEIERLETENKALIEEIANVTAAIVKDKENNDLFASYRAEYESKMNILNAWSDLDGKFGSANGEKLMKLVQGYTLDILLNIANLHLKGMTGRYEMTRVSVDYLAIEVIDLDMLSERRSVNSLSGGETFLVSLALALALSSISSNRMNVESLFIDEGFGALDSDTLKTVMGALEKLQSEGRKIGIISHLAEMLEQIPVKVTVEKMNSGKSRIKIEG